MAGTLLIDADIPAYAIAAKCETTADFGEDYELAVDLSPEQIEDMVTEEIEWCMKKTKCDQVIVALSDPTTPGYFRRELEPTYKMTTGRAARKPELLQSVKNHLADRYKYYVRPRLEADDVLGILATHPYLIEGRKVICSADKDLRTIPAPVFNPQKPELGVMDIDPLDADRFHMYQTIVGDTTDGYPGCPGIGEKSPFAEEIIEADRNELWDIVLDAYASKGRTEDDAILQARMARILRAEDYNFKTHKIKLWNPIKLTNEWYVPS